MNASQTLGALIRDRQASTGWSLRDLSDRSPSGAGLNKDRWGELRRDEAKTFSGAQLLGIAEALGVPESIVGRAALATMGVTAQAGSAARVEDAVRTDNELSEHDRRILLAVLREMRMERGGNADSTAPMNQAGMSPDTHKPFVNERRGRSDPLGEFERQQAAASSPSTAESRRGSLAGRLADQHRRPDDDELARRRREREAVEGPEQATIPLPDEALMAGYDAPSEGRAMREQQDADAEGPQD